MAYELNRKLKGIEPYLPINESYAVRLDANESCFNIGDKLGDAFSQAVKNIDFNRYPDSSAELATQGFASFYGISPDNCTAGNGSDELISIILSAFFEKGDAVLTLSPDFSMYAFYGYIDELKIKALPKEDDLSVNVPRVIEYCNNNNVKAVIFSNPCNPTSLGVSRKDIIRLIKNVFCLVIIDEAYMDFWGESVLDQTENYDNLIVLKTCSKNIGLAGLRLGFAVACENITNALKAVKSPYNINSVTQALACEAFRHKALIDEYTAEIIESRKYLMNAMNEIAEGCTHIERVYDSVTNFVFVKTPKARIIYEKLLEKSISVRFMGNYLRITAGTESENKMFLAALKEILTQL